jgi:hypothetical protein
VGWATVVRFPAGARDFSLNVVQTGSGGHQASYPMGRIKREGCEADHSLPSSAEVKNGEAITPLLHTSSWRSAELHN